MQIAVVGAGPAGSWASALLARRGHSVTLIDSQAPWEKPCGGGVTGRALALVGDAIAAAPLKATVITRARFIDSSTGRSTDVDLQADGLTSRSTLVVASRREFESVFNPSIS